MTVHLKKTIPAGAIPISAIDRAGFAKFAASLPAGSREWLKTVGFTGAAYSHALVPGVGGKLGRVIAGAARADDPYVLSALPLALPQGQYRLASDGLPLSPEAASLSWELGTYEFDLYKPRKRAPAQLNLASDSAARRGKALATVICGTRDLINTPTEHLGPQHLSTAVQTVATQYGAQFRAVVGDALLKQNFPAIHAVGRASDRPPRLIELNWGKAGDPLVALVGKGVCFDSGGLDIKSAEGMRQMKKDMGGAANALGLATMVMALKLPVRLQLLIPAVENAIAGNAYKPGDVFKTRKGIHIEIGNTDAEGRVILCDALAYAAEGKPALIIDMATLTGAARVALGPQLPALFCRSMGMARELVDLGLQCDDPLWHMPLWTPYQANIESSIGDIVNTGRNPMGGAINAALFLEYFIPAKQEWLHVDMYAGNETSRPGRPAGGEAQSIRTLLAYLERRFTPAG